MKRAVLLLLLSACSAPSTSTGINAEGEAAAVPVEINVAPTPSWTDGATVRHASRSRLSLPRKASGPCPIGCGSATGTPLNWTALAECESSGNPRAVSASGKYRGLYQMDADFWRTYGGLIFASRPDLASAAEQTVVAQRGYTARGRSPWPVCGGRL